MYALLGSISHGTMRPADLIPIFASTLSSLMQNDAPGAMATDWRTSFNQLIADADALAETGYEFEDANEIVTELFDALDCYAPPFCYFGSLEGDGADYGFWVGDIEDAVQFGEAIKVNAGDDCSSEYCTDVDYVFSITDHGNVTCFERHNKDWIEVWSIV